jgi:hypothetical protein
VIHPVHFGFFLLLDKGNGSIVGYMAQFNFWAHTGLPPPALKALSLGINGIGANGLPWASYIGHRKGNANLIQGLTTYTPGRLQVDRNSFQFEV